MCGSLTRQCPSAFMSSLMIFGKTKQVDEVEEGGGGQHCCPGSEEQASRLMQLQG